MQQPANFILEEIQDIQVKLVTILQLENPAHLAPSRPIQTDPLHPIQIDPFCPFEIAPFK